MSSDVDPWQIIRDVLEEHSIVVTSCELCGEHRECDSCHLEFTYGNTYADHILDHVQQEFKHQKVQMFVPVREDDSEYW